MFQLRPFNRKDDFFEKIAKSFDEMFDKDFLPAFDEGFKSLRTDITESKDAYVVKADLPGFSKDDINIEIDNNYLTIRAKREENNEVRDKKDKIIRQERHFGEFVRSFYVDDIDQDRIEAELDNGVLKIKLPKVTPTDEGPTKRIDIK